MKNTLQHLLIFFALGLCGLCTWQWFAQVQQHTTLTTLRQTIADQAVERQRSANSIAAMDKQIAQMDAHLTELKNTQQTNAVEILTLRTENQRLTATFEQSKAVTETRESRLKQANEVIKNVTGQRDDFLKRLNTAIADRNEIVAKYNTLVQQVEGQPAAPAKPEPANKK